MWKAARKPVSPSEKAVVASCSPPKMAIFNSLGRELRLLVAVAELAEEQQLIGDLGC